MKGWQMYSKIQAMKEQGFSIRQVSTHICASRNTVRKYWEMDPETFATTYTTVNRTTALQAYESIIVKWLETYPNMTAAQVRDWLSEKYKLEAADRTVRRYVLNLRKQYGLAKQMEPKREYEAVEELPKGYQLQLDFGEKQVRDAYSSRYHKLCFVVFTLSHSRYKWGTFQDKPFLSVDLVRALYRCFDYMGGMPRQLVYDQDSIIVVSENNGDIIHTQAFASFLDETKLAVRVCRKSDPESKGLVEASVKFVKRNFMENRLYTGLDIWNQTFEDWLVRTGNGNQHGTTKRKPAEVFAEEQHHLLPLYGAAPVETAKEMDRNVRADNTVLYKSNRYSVPYGTYSKEKKVFLVAKNGKLEIMDRAGEPLALHDISEAKGKLIKMEIHRRNKQDKIKEQIEKAVSLLGEEFRKYIEVLCETKPRYVKEQLNLVLNTCEVYNRNDVLAAMQYCVEKELYSAGDLWDAAGTIAGQKLPHIQPSRLPVSGNSPQPPLTDERYHIPVENRALTVYAEVAAAKGSQKEPLNGSGVRR